MPEESAATKKMLQDAVDDLNRDLETKGLHDPFRAWSESMPEERIPDPAVMDQFYFGIDAEAAAEQGRLEVRAGETEEGPAGTPPGQGPDGEEPGPDEPGDTPGEGDEPTDELTAIPGLWMPPAEADADNFEAPTTKDMVLSDEWAENAYQFWEFMGRPNIHKPWQSASGNVGQMKFAGQETPEMSETDIAEWAESQIAGFNWNLMNTTALGTSIMTADDPKSALAFLNLLNMYDFSDGGGYEFMRALGYIGTDPTTYFGLGAGGLAAKGVAKKTAKTGLTNAIKLALAGGTAGAVEGGALAGGFDLTKQNIEQEAGAREDIDYGQTGVATLFGIGLGTTLGGGGGYLAGRFADKFARAAAPKPVSPLMREAQMQTRAGRIKEASEMPLETLVNMIEASQRASQLAGVSDDFTEAAIKLLGDTGEAPRTKDGEIDWPAVEKILEDISVGRERAAAERRAKFEAEIEAQKKLDQESIKERAASADRGLERVAGSDEMSFPHGDDPKAEMDEFKRMADELGVEVELEFDAPSGSTKIKFASPEDADKFQQNIAQPEAEIFTFPEGKKVEPRFEPEVAKAESKELVRRLMEIEELKADEIVMAAPGRKGSTVIDDAGQEFEVIGRTENGWYKVRSELTGVEKNLRRKDFGIRESSPQPDRAGVMQLSPFSDEASRVIAMAEAVSSKPLEHVAVTHKEQQAIADSLQSLGVDITAKQITDHWTPSELLYLRNTYDAISRDLGRLARVLNTHQANGGKILDTDLAFFNAAHAKMVAVRDLFYGVRGNAARQLNILQSAPKNQVYDMSAMMVNTINTQGGRVQTERTIALMADLAGREGVAGVSKASQRVWGNRTAQGILNVRYNFMLSSWRTHFFNTFGNSLSGLYEGLLVRPAMMAISNAEYASKLALSRITGKVPDPTERITLSQIGAEWKGMMGATRDSLALAKEIAMGRDIGEGKVWNELGLRYDVVNVPDNMFGKIGSTPVRMLEAGDAFFKNQYYNARMQFLAHRRAAAESIKDGTDFDEVFNRIMDEQPPDMAQEAKNYAAKMTYTNDPNVYGGILASLAQMAQAGQSRSLFINMLMPFVRTPANLLSYSMEMIGANTVLSPSRLWANLNDSNPLVRQEAMAKLTVATGLWMYVADKYENGEITGAGPANFQERKAWETAGWQANSIKIRGKWVDMSRADPGGQSLSQIATVFDYITLSETEERPPLEWLGAGLMYTGDMIKDESYLSTITDAITVLESQEGGRGKGILASTINSVLVPNFLRDIRRVTDPGVRSTADQDVLGQLTKQMQNALPFSTGMMRDSESLPPRRDWRGDPVHYFGNAYQRALIPFNIKDPMKSDEASMALAYARIPISTPSRQIAMTGGGSLNLMAMDNGAGHVYDKYLEMVGQSRAEIVDKVMKMPIWRDAVKNDDIGPGSTGELLLRRALSIGTGVGKKKMVLWLMDNEEFTTSGGRKVLIQHPVSLETYARILQQVKIDEVNFEGEFPQYLFDQPREGPEFFRPTE